MAAPQAQPHKRVASNERRSSAFLVCVCERGWHEILSFLSHRFPTQPNTSGDQRVAPKAKSELPGLCHLCVSVWTVRRSAFGAATTELGGAVVVSSVYSWSPLT